MASKIGGVVLVAAAMSLAGLAPLSAQQGPQKPAPQAGPAANPGAPATPVLQLPDAYKLNMMIRTAVIALNQANLTGNYTVLRDLGATSFRMTNDASRLAEIFADLRKRKLDLSPVLFFMPKLIQQPQINERGLIRLAGYFETAPERINFDIYYIFEAGQWRLFGIGVLLTPAVDATAALPQQNNAPASGTNNAAATPPADAKSAASAENPVKPAATGATRTKPAKALENTGPAAAAKPVKAATENKTTGNAARIQLGAPAASPAPAPFSAPAEAAQSDAGAPAPKEKSKDGDGFLSFW
jgi:hypothetical protein